MTELSASHSTANALLRPTVSKPAIACHLELMGLPDCRRYQELARGVLKTAYARDLLLGLNVPNKKPGEPLYEWAGALRSELPHVKLCVHYSLKHQKQVVDSSFSR